MDEHVRAYRDNGYAIIPGVFTPGEMEDISEAADAVYAEANRHPQSLRHGNLHFEIIDDQRIGHTLLHVHWVSWMSPLFERLRRDGRYLEILEPLIDRDIKQIANQIHWKHPGAQNARFRFHQDARFRRPAEAYRNIGTSFVQTGLAIDPQTSGTGALTVFPGSHKLGYLGLADEGNGYVMKGEDSDDYLRAKGLDPARAVPLELEPGDVVIWNAYTVHGSGPNEGSHLRRFLINGYMRAEDCDRGEWAFRGGEPTPLGREPARVKFDETETSSGPRYIESTWHRD